MRKPTKTEWIAYGLVLLGEAAYLILTMAAPTPPPDPNSPIHLTQTETVLLQLSILVPYLIAWLAGVRGAIGFKRCGETVEGEGGGGFRTLGIGVAVLVGGGVLSSAFGAIRPYLGQSFAVSATFTIIGNYISVLTNLISALFLYRGAARLVGPTENRAHERDDLIMAGILAAIIAALYLPLIFSNATRATSSNPSVAPSYYLPDALIVLTVVLPYLASWTLGFLTSLRITRYAPPGRDADQRKAVRKFVNGLWMMIFSSILLELLLSIGNARLLSLGIGSILALVYVFLVLQIAGFTLISIGAKRLCRAPEPDSEPPLQVKAVHPL